VRSEDIERSVERTRANGFDPGVVLDLSREAPSGETIRWKLSLRAEPIGDGLVPFVIDWGDTPHPAESQPEGTRCRLDHFSGDHPEPAVVVAALDALGAALEVRPGNRARLNAAISGPAGTFDLTAA
jgi:hypothetical protein